MEIKMIEVGMAVVGRGVLTQDKDLKVGIIVDLHDWGYQDDVHVVEYRVLWNNGKTYVHYDWDLEAL